MRRLLGYRLKEEKYRKAAERIISKGYKLVDYKDEVHFMQGCVAHDIFKAAGVMHWFEEVYEEENLEVGKWYWSGIGGLWFIEQFKGGGQKSYGFNFKSEWCVSGHRFSSGLKPATSEEVQQALVKEATKRGFKEGVRYIWPDHQHIEPRTIKGELDLSSDLCLSDGAFIIFMNGKWAEILPTETLNGKTAIIDGVEYELKIKN